MNTRAEEILISVIDLYLEGQIDGVSFVQQIDDLVGDDKLTGLNAAIKQEFDKLHETIAICVWDDLTEASGGGLYIREPEMRNRVMLFRQMLDN